VVVTLFQKQAGLQIQQSNYIIMKLDSLGNYHKDAALGRIITGVICALSVLMCFYFYYDSRTYVENYTKKRIVIDQQNNAWLATEREFTRTDRAIQYEDHVSDFYRLFHGFDGPNFETNVNRALVLIDTELGENLYTKIYKEKRTARDVVDNNWTLKAEVLKVEIDVGTTPARGIIYGKQTLIRPNDRKSRNLHVRFKIRDVGVSHENPHGAMIIDYDIFDDSVIVDERR
jgi:hypothetical protein